MPFSVWNVGFIFGGLSGWLNRHTSHHGSAGLWLAGLALVLFGELASPGAQLFLAGPGITLIVVSLSRIQKPDDHVYGLGMRILFLLGEYSYGLYLAHSLSIQIALEYLSPATLSKPVSVFAGMIGVGLFAGLAAGFMDVIIYRTLKRMIDQRISVKHEIQAQQS